MYILVRLQVIQAFLKNISGCVPLRWLIKYDVVCDEIEDYIQNYSL